MGPASIESHYDEALAVPGVLDEIARGEREGADGYVLACFGDPGLDAARELATGPVVAIAEAGMKVATYLGRGFTVVTTLERTIGRAWDLAALYGVKDACRNIRACEIPVLDLEIPGSPARAVITAECARAVAEDDCDVIVLGCAGMADLAADDQPVDRCSGGRRRCRGDHHGAIVGDDGPDHQHPLRIRAAEGEGRPGAAERLRAHLTAMGLASRTE